MSLTSLLPRIASESRRARQRAMRSLLALALLAWTPLFGQSVVEGLELDLAPLEALPFVCPMDPDIRSGSAGVCSRCGMQLVFGLPVPAEYPVRLTTTPAAVRAGEPVELGFEVLQPDNGERQTEFELVHEKLFHLFWVNHDLEVFRHEHPTLGDDGIFRIETTFDRPGVYRLMGDFYPTGGTPQMIPMTLTTAGFEEPLEMLAPRLAADREPKRGRNVKVSLRTDPPEPLAGLLTLLFFELNTARGLQKYLGAWAHMLAVKDDLITMMHGHPSIADGGKLIQMNVIFPEPGMYRVWVQVRRKGKVSTLPFTVEVSGLPSL
ncbi:MAG: hypothetical protein F4Y47_22145 [Acidobacteriia bacterium]|nr:hypothetical protein [Terriglobia bacterium]MYK11671.1 hypothetical protein [Terriglobia bacterium]